MIPLLNSLSLLAATLLVTTADATSNNVTIPELGVYNFASEIQKHIWTCVLFYDHLDEKAQNRHLMESLAQVFSNNDSKDRVGFAMLDIRAHPTYRAHYKFPNDPHPFIYEFYTEYPEVDPNDVLTLSSRTFMNLQGDLYWPSRLALFAQDYNVYGELDLDFNSEVQAKVAILTHWIGSTIRKQPDELQVLVKSQLNIEREIARKARGRDNEFAFDRYFAEKAQEKLEEEQEEDEAEDNDGDSSKPQEERFLLESGTDEETSAEAGFYRHGRITIHYRPDSIEWLDLLADVTYKYLVVMEAWEIHWDDERKARENEQTNFGHYKKLMEYNLHAMLDNIFTNPDYEPPQRDEDEEAEQGASQELRDEIPLALKPYLDEMVFGYARTPASLKEHLNYISDTLGPTPEARRAARQQQGTPKFEMFERMREYMKLTEQVAREPFRYVNALADLTSQWYNLVVEFQDNLQEYYVSEYLPSNPDLHHNNNFTRHAMDVIDMQDPANAAFLADYDAFSKKYTLPAVPTILANVNMTDEVYTLEYMIEQCAAMDVTRAIKISNPVGKKSTEGWGGLDKFVLDDSLATPDRIETVELENGDETEAIDRDITLEQFITLSEKLGNLYLHDMSVPDDCDGILYEDTLYGGHSKFRLPHVVGAYDLFHRATLYNYARSWPSLFIGKKHSNSKVHVDSGATGFFMYLVSGRKRWIVYNPSERPFLYDRIDIGAFVPDVLGMDKSDAANEYLSKRFPLLHRAEQAYEIIQEPGQLIYIPPSSPHAVENLDDIVGIALNLAPRDALANHIHDQIHHERKFGYTELALKYWLFEDNARNHIETKDPLYASFAEYKAQY